METITRENKFHLKVREWIKGNAPKQFVDYSLDEIPTEVFTLSQKLELNNLLNEFYNL